MNDEIVTIRKLDRACFPLPMCFEKPEQRFTLRDGARFAAYLQERGVRATKLLVGNPDQDRPESPLLRVAGWEQWRDPEWWQHEAFDLVVLYGRPWEAMAAIRRGSPQTVVGLKMDTGYGVQVSPFPSIRAMLRRYPFYRYVQEYSVFRTLAHTVGNIVKNSGQRAVQRQKMQLALPHLLLYESPMAMDETAKWCQRHGVPEYIGKLVLAPHPVLETMAYSDEVAKQSHSVVSVAKWTARYKDARLLVETAVRVLGADPEAIFRIVGQGSRDVKQRIITASSRKVADRVSAVEFVHPSEMHDEMQKAQVYLGTSLCESFGISVAEALCCGCSVALAPGIAVPSYRWFASEGGGTLAKTRYPVDLAQAVKKEFDRWDQGTFDPQASSVRWCGLCHTGQVLDTILEKVRCKL